MAEEMIFKGFSKQMLHFLSQLDRNNSRTWFDSHRMEYEQYIMIPSRLFVVAMGKKIKKISRNINAIPLVNKSLFRINRDIRFSQNKNPYNTNLGILFWEGNGRKRTECSGFYFSINATSLFLGAGIYTFSPLLLKIYRNTLTVLSACRELKKAITRVNESRLFTIGGKKLKKVPHGYPVNEENKELLKRKGIYASYESGIPDVFHNEEILDFCLEKFMRMAPIHRWLIKFIHHSIYHT
jgi:uncharacterized protein (TIGR02453 family)